MCFDLTQDHSQNQHGVNLIKSGTVNLTIGFENATAANLVLMVLAYYEQIIEISKFQRIVKLVLYNSSNLIFESSYNKTAVCL